jgi:hypothetical protein
VLSIYTAELDDRYQEGQLFLTLLCNFNKNLETLSNFSDLLIIYELYQTVSRIYQTVSRICQHRASLARARFVAVDGLFLYVGAQTVLRLMMTILPFFVGSICLPVYFAPYLLHNEVKLFLIEHEKSTNAETPPKYVQNLSICVMEPFLVQ